MDKNGQNRGKLRKTKKKTYVEARDDARAQQFFTSLIGWSETGGAVQNLEMNFHLEATARGKHMKWTEQGKSNPLKS